MTYVANHTNKRCYVSCGDRCTCGGGDLLPESALKSITNLDSVEDGVYEIVVRVLSRDFESGYHDDWEYVLYPYSG